MMKSQFLLVGIVAIGLFASTPEGVAHGGGGDASASITFPATGASGCSVGERRGGPAGAAWARVSAAGHTSGSLISLPWSVLRPKYLCRYN